MEIRLRQTYSFHQTGQRDNQEDSRSPDCDAPSAACRTFVVCDGVGGQDKGEVASRIVANALSAYMARVDTSRPFTPADFGKALTCAYKALAEAGNKSNKGMATTLTFLCINGGGALAAHIGDSRIYHLRPGGGILYRSSDHSWVNAMVHCGNLTPQEAINHPHSNYITRCMQNEDDAADKRSPASVLQITDIEAGDYFFLCSDGVLHNIDDEKLMSIVESGLSDKDKMDTIAALSRDSSDNNTAFLIPVDEVVADSDNNSDEGACPAEDHAKEDTTVIIDKRNVVEDICAEQQSWHEKVSSFLKRLMTS